MNAITISYLLLCGLALALFVAPKIRWWVKLPVIAAAPFLTFIVWHAAGSFSGWPVTLTPPAHSIFVSAQIFEPDPAQHDQGEIVLWLVPLSNKSPLFGYKSNGREARAYRVPYSRQLHQQIVRAQRMGQQGTPVELDHARHARPGSRVPPWAVRHYHLPPSHIPFKEQGGQQQ